MTRSGELPIMSDVKTPEGCDTRESDLAKTAKQRPAPGLASASSKALARKRLLTKVFHESQGALIAQLRRSFGNGPPDPEDTVQLAFQKLAERNDLSDIRDFQAFLWRTARNLVLKEKRSEDVRNRYDFELEHLYFPLQGDELTPQRVSEVKEQLRMVSAALQSMPERRAQAFVAVRIEGLSINETASRLGVSRTAVNNHIARAAADIDAALANTDHD